MSAKEYYRTNSIKKTKEHRRQAKEEDIKMLKIGLGYYKRILLQISHAGLFNPLSENEKDNTKHQTNLTWWRRRAL